MTSATSIDDEAVAHGQPRGKVVNCYATAHSFFPSIGLLDLTEGIYHGDPSLAHAQAQANQHDYLLDSVRCESGSRVLDIGCGYATLVDRAALRGARAVGITISPEQVAHTTTRGLDVRLVDYRATPSEWNGTFDGIIANGSAEHFVGSSDAIAGRTDVVYRELFATVHRLIDPDSNARRFATTIIHFVREPKDPRDVARNPLAFRWGSDEFHWAVLDKGWGGWYPTLGQLERCAEGYFDLVDEVDGTEDYWITTQWWSDQIMRSLRTPAGIANVMHSLPALLRSPKEYLTIVLAALSCGSWGWQFEPPNPPTRLLRQVWAYRDR